MGTLSLCPSEWTACNLILLGSWKKSVVELHWGNFWGFLLLTLFLLSRFERTYWSLIKPLLYKTIVLLGKLVARQAEKQKNCYANHSGPQSFLSKLFFSYLCKFFSLWDKPWLSLSSCSTCRSWFSIYENWNLMCWKGKHMTRNTQVFISSPQMPLCFMRAQCRWQRHRAD